jgi:hypothetical protein
VFSGRKDETMRAGRKPVCTCERVFVVAVLLLLTPAGAMAGGIELNFEWEPNPEHDIAGYRLFCRDPGEDYDYDNPAWEGQENVCSLYLDDRDAVCLFVVRAFDEDGFESNDSNEVVYPDDGGAEDENSEDSRYLSGSGSSSGGGCFIDTLN